MPTVTISRGSTLATGINIFTLPPERQEALLETLTAINREILKHKYPMNVSANFHRAIDASIVINYNQYTDRASGQHLRTRPDAAPLMKRTHELSEKHEIRWYEVADVIAAKGPADTIEISDDRGVVAVIGIFTTQPTKQDELLTRLRLYGETLKSSEAGFIGIATHRGYQGEYVASYEQWASVEAYRQGIKHAPVAAALKAACDIAAVTELHPYDVLSVTRFL
jgi:heme-degrading monooxygenase HmoA